MNCEICNERPAVVKVGGGAAATFDVCADCALEDSAKAMMEPLNSDRLDLMIAVMSQRPAEVASVLGLEESTVAAWCAMRLGRSAG
jgi:protein-arginine kinase activator protein McsA